MRRPASKAALALCVSLALSVLCGGACAGSDFRYDPHGKRDPFVPLVGMDKPAVSRLEDATSITDVKIEGIAGSSGGKMSAILNGEIVKEGDRFGDVGIKKITAKAVTIIMSGKVYEKKLIEEGGSKSGR
ncbi:MAG: hypothetical protein V1682_07740 [Candidatus Omnitrophota bacterium]